MLSQGTYCKGTSCMWETFAFLPNLEYFVILSLQFWPTRFAVLVPPPVITKVQYTRAWVAIVPIQLERHSNLKKYGPPSSNFQVYAHWVITQPTGATGVWNTTVKAASYRPTWFHRMAQWVYKATEASITAVGKALSGSTSVVWSFLITTPTKSQSHKTNMFNYCNFLFAML